MEKNIQDLMDDWRTAKNRVMVARRKEFGAEIEVRRELSKLSGSRIEDGTSVDGVSAAAIEIGHWACEASPIGICAYDGYEDPIQDNCLYCNNPEERK
jgi:hypothetical protein